MAKMLLLQLFSCSFVIIVGASPLSLLRQRRSDDSLPPTSDIVSDVPDLIVPVPRQRTFNELNGTDNQDFEYLKTILRAQLQTQSAVNELQNSMDRATRLAACERQAMAKTKSLSARATRYLMQRCRIMLENSTADDALLIQQNVRATEHSNVFTSRTWAEYKEGFGDESGDYWIGNDLLHLLTTDNQHCGLRVDLDPVYWAESYVYAAYSNFSVSSESTGYKLDVSGFSGNASIDALSYQNGAKFTTIDRNNHGSVYNCAASYGGFWYGDQHAACTLNGKTNNCWWQHINGGYILKTSRMWLICS